MKIYRIHSPEYQRTYVDGVNANSNPFYSQAAPGQDENPFLTDDLGQPIAGELSRSARSKLAVPPKRPPLPQKLRSQSASPAHSTTTPHRPPPPSSSQMTQATSKNFFDEFDFNTFNAFESSTAVKARGGLTGQQGVAAVVNNPSQRHAFAPNTQKFSSPGEVVLNVDSNAAIGGG